MMYVKTERLELKPISESSLNGLVELLTDDAVKLTYMVPDFPNRREAEKLARRLICLSEQKERHVVGIYYEDALIGILNETDSMDRWIEVGYAILPRYHNQGFCTEALRSAIGYFFTQGFREVLAGAFEENTASIRVMIKSGMEKLDRRDEIEYRGRIHRCVYYSRKR
ncbi:MAG: GNAT family N-acetyltransferase [Oscillospiraceae bacterium]|nr:GNAT family N-acetyltransferase [Oscillospiraceae bacterium]